MASSQEKNEKYLDIIEKAIQERVKDEKKKVLLGDYTDFLLDELRIQEDDEKVLQNNLDIIKNGQDSTLETKYLKLQEKVIDCEKYIDNLKDEIDNITIQSLADNERLQIENAEKQQKIITYYEIETTKLKKQLELNREKQKITEQEIKNQIALESATRNARLEEMKGNLQRQIVEKNSFLLKIQNEHKDLRKELNTLKSAENTNQYRNAKAKPTLMEFQNESLVQQKKVDVYNNKNQANSKMLTPIFNYDTNNYKNQLNYALPTSNKSLVTNKNSMTHNTASIHNTKTIDNFNNQKFNVKNTYRKQFQPEFNALHTTTTFLNLNKNQDPITKNLQCDSLTHQETSFTIDDYQQINETFTVPLIGADLKKAESDLPTHNKRNSLSSYYGNRASQKSKSSISCIPNPVISPGPNISQIIDDPDVFDKDLSNMSESCNSIPSDVSRKAPTLYKGESRKRKKYKVIIGDLSLRESCEDNGITLNRVLELNAKKRK